MTSPESVSPFSTDGHYPAESAIDDAIKNALQVATIAFEEVNAGIVSCLSKFDITQAKTILDSFFNIDYGGHLLMDVTRAGYVFSAWETIFEPSQETEKNL